MKRELCHQARMRISTDQQPVASELICQGSFIQELELYKEEAKHNRMETQDNGFLLVIDGVRKEKERLTAAKLLVF